MMGKILIDLNTFMMISVPVLLRMANISNNGCRENQNANFMLEKFFFENLPIYKMMWENVAESGRPQTKI